VSVLDHLTVESCSSSLRRTTTESLPQAISSALGKYKLGVLWRFVHLLFFLISSSTYLLSCLQRCQQQHGERDDPCDDHNDGGGHSEVLEIFRGECGRDGIARKGRGIADSQIGSGNNRRNYLSKFRSIWFAEFERSSLEWNQLPVCCGE
jgi:hypothetical protein